MKIIYIADDGSQFDNEFDCMDYEWRLAHPNLKYIDFYDKDNNKLNNVLSEETYTSTEKIVVFNANALKDLQELAEYTGFCCYEDINERGIWIFDDEKGRFIRT